MRKRNSFGRSVERVARGMVVAIRHFALHLLDGIPGKANYMCFYDGSAYNETEKATGKMRFGRHLSVNRNQEYLRECSVTFGRWDENKGILRTFGR